MITLQHTDANVTSQMTTDQKTDKIKLPRAVRQEDSSLPKKMEGLITGTILLDFQQAFKHFQMEQLVDNLRSIEISGKAL